jgi:molecular chaperone DnaK (HSP70)
MTRISMQDIMLGIDFGTSNSSVAIWRLDKKTVKIIKDPQSKSYHHLYLF